MDLELRRTRSVLRGVTWVRLPSSAWHRSEPRTSLPERDVTPAVECCVGHGTPRESVAATVGAESAQLCYYVWSRLNYHAQVLSRGCSPRAGAARSDVAGTLRRCGRPTSPRSWSDVSGHQGCRHAPIPTFGTVPLSDSVVMGVGCFLVLI